jgi:hypothetical protein
VSAAPHVQHGSTYEADPDLGEGNAGRVVLGYVRVVDRMKFALPVEGEAKLEHVYLEVDETCPLLEPSAWESQRLRPPRAQGPPEPGAPPPIRFVVVEWREKRRWVPATNVVGVDEKSALALRRS